MSSDNKPGKTSVIYVTLDCLLDTRLGTLAKEHPDFATNALKSGTYHTRDCDAFPDVTHERFKKLYKDRDIDTLAMSVFTNVITVLQSCIKGSFDDFALGGQNEGVEIVVNTHPYNLDEATVDEIAKAIAHHTFQSTNITVVKIPDEYLTPAYCKENYALMIMYSIDEWITLHAKAFEKLKMPGMGLLAPAIYEKIPTEEEFDELKKVSLHPFRATEMSLAPLFSLRLLEVEVFSIHRNIKPRKPKPPEPDVAKTVNPSGTSA